MKTRTTAIFALFASLMLFVGLQDAQAQKFSLMLNYNNQDKTNVSSNTTGEISSFKSANVSLNARYYTNSKFAVRAGVGVDNLNYAINTTDGITTDLESKRKDLQGIFGLEWHPTLGRKIDIYPGVYIPVTVVGEDLIDTNLANLTNGGLSTGLGALVGVNVKFLKIFRAGVEFDARYQNFKAATQNAVGELSLEPYKGLNYTTNFTIGIML